MRTMGGREWCEELRRAAESSRRERFVRTRCAASRLLRGYAAAKSRCRPPPVRGRVGRAFGVFGVTNIEKPCPRRGVPRTINCATRCGKWNRPNGNGTAPDAISLYSTFLGAAN